MYEPFISVVIPVYNGSNYLKEALDSVLNQSYIRKEIIVVDDGSCDEGRTQKIINSYKNKIRPFFKKNGGVATALNLAIKNMKGDYFAWLSHDDLLKPNALEVYADYLQQIEPETILYGNYDIIDETSQPYNIIDFLSKYTRDELEDSVYPVLMGCVNGCSCLIHKSHFTRVGYFNEDLKITQDNEMWFRIFRGQKVKFVQEILSSKRYHRQQDSNIKDVYPDEDRFIVDSLKSLTIREASSFDGNLSRLYLHFKKIAVDGKHPLVEELCKDMLKKAESTEAYEKMNEEELRELLAKSNSSYQELQQRYEELQQKYVRQWMR